MPRILKVPIKTRITKTSLQLNAQIRFTKTACIENKDKSKYCKLFSKSKETSRENQWNLTRNLICWHTKN